MHDVRAIRHVLRRRISLAPGLVAGRDQHEIRLCHGVFARRQAARNGPRPLRVQRADERPYLVGSRSERSGDIFRQWRRIAVNHHRGRIQSKLYATLEAFYPEFFSRFTDEIAIYPEGASLAKGDFKWRLSSARIESASSFSMFPMHDRVLVVLKGHGIRMAHTYEEGEPEEEFWCSACVTTYSVPCEREGCSYRG
ncbi:hypothetical protein EBS80_04795 [bacterium]|nr:hypothetical protein [bacterium]